MRYGTFLFCLFTFIPLQAQEFTTLLEQQIQKMAESPPLWSLQAPRHNSSTPAETPVNTCHLHMKSNAHHEVHWISECDSQKALEEVKRRTFAAH